VDIVTTTPPETRRLATSFDRAGATLLDVPVSGGAAGARAASLYLFGGGDSDTLERLRPMFESLGTFTVCGPSGSGQIVKGVNQLMMGLGWAAYLEAMAYGVGAGIAAKVIADAVAASVGDREEVDDGDIVQEQVRGLAAAFDARFGRPTSAAELDKHRLVTFGEPVPAYLTDLNAQPMKEPRHPLLAQGKARYVGDPVAVVTVVDPG
jgi:hypothetical protein